MATTYKMTIGGAVASLLGKIDHEEYQEIGIKLTAKDLAKQLGLTATPMLYHYMSGKTENITVDRAIHIAKTFNIIVGEYDSIEQMEEDYNSANKGAEMVKLGNRPIVEAIITAEKINDLMTIKQALRKIIVRYY